VTIGRREWAVSLGAKGAAKGAACGFADGEYALFRCDQVTYEQEEEMRALIVILLAGAIAAGTMSGCVSTQGDKAGCPAQPEGKVKCAKAPCGKSGKCSVTKGLKLTDEQKDKVKAIQEKCMTAGCTEDSCKAMMEELKTILTPEQMAQCEKNCDKMMKKKGCCKNKAEAKKVEKKVEKKVKKADDTGEVK
jgi:Spy/CpxP family protein refolding chaperone